MVEVAKGEIVRAESVVSETKDQVTIIVLFWHHHHHYHIMSTSSSSSLPNGSRPTLFIAKQIELTVDAKKHVHLDYGSLNR